MGHAGQGDSPRSPQRGPVPARPPQAPVQGATLLCSREASEASLPSQAHRRDTLLSAALWALPLGPRLCWLREAGQALAPVQLWAGWWGQAITPLPASSNSPQLLREKRSTDGAEGRSPLAHQPPGAGDPPGTSTSAQSRQGRHRAPSATGLVMATWCSCPSPWLYSRTWSPAGKPKRGLQRIPTAGSQWEHLPQGRESPVWEVSPERSLKASGCSSGRCQISPGTAHEGRSRRCRRWSPLRARPARADRTTHGHLHLP